MIKIQDIIFLAILGFLVLKRNPRWAVAVGLISLVLSIPLFSFWIFFTAERLVYYAAGFFLLSVILLIYENRN